MIAFLVLAMAAQANTEPPGLTAEGPTAVARSYFDAMRRGDYRRSASLMDRQQLEAMRRYFLPIFETARPEDTQALVTQFFGSRSLEEVKALDAVELYARMQAAWAHEKPKAKAFEYLAASRFNPLGLVYEGSDLAHVVYRIHFDVPNYPSSVVDIVTLRRTGNDWRVLPEGKVEGLFEKLSRTPALR